MSGCVVWFRRDLRVVDNPALLAAVRRGGPVICLFVWAPEEEGDWAPGAASRWWLHQSLDRLDASLRRLGSRLILRRGPTREAIEEVVAATQCDAVCWNRVYEPETLRRDAMVKRYLRENGTDAESFNGSLLLEPWEVVTGQGRPYQVFTPFWKACTARLPPGPPQPAPVRLPSPPARLHSLALKDLALEPTIDWAAGFRAAWTPGEEGAKAALDTFLNEGLAAYADSRNRPDLPSTSRLSPHLHFGEISIRQVWHAVQGHPQARNSGRYHESIRVFFSELGWREFAHHLLYHFPNTPDTPLRQEFRDFPWEPNRELLRAWQRGRTGYPIVDAGMRELWHTGWMHNRVRMIVASFLVKHLLIPWTEGARWFWDTLVDADLANNTLGWQWTAGCGADAAPYFRVFNPVLQGKKFDPDGVYVRRWLPELKDVPTPYVHNPWEMSAKEGVKAGLTPGDRYPPPIVEHSAARAQALKAWAALRK